MRVESFYTHLAGVSIIVRGRYLFKAHKLCLDVNVALLIIGIFNKAGLDKTLGITVSIAFSHHVDVKN